MERYGCAFLSVNQSPRCFRVGNHGGNDGPSADKQDDRGWGVGPRAIIL